jgi:addiction module HigA family antidote
VLQRYYLEPLGISAGRLARDTALAPNRIYNVIDGKNGVTPDTALRLGKYFETIPAADIPAGHHPADPRWWLSLQADYDLTSCSATEDWQDLQGRILSYKRVPVAHVPQPLLPGFARQRSGSRRLKQG